MYGTEISDAPDVFAGTSKLPFVAGTSTPLIRIHVYAFVAWDHPFVI